MGCGRRRRPGACCQSRRSRCCSHACTSRRLPMPWAGPPANARAQRARSRAAPCPVRGRAAAAEAWRPAGSGRPGRQAPQCLAPAGLSLDGHLLARQAAGHLDLVKEHLEGGEVLLGGGMAAWEGIWDERRAGTGPLLVVPWATDRRRAEHCSRAPGPATPGTTAGAPGPWLMQSHTSTSAFWTTSQMEMSKNR
jgi:hypothetical protein